MLAFILLFSTVPRLGKDGIRVHILAMLVLMAAIWGLFFGLVRWIERL